MAASCLGRIRRHCVISLSGNRGNTWVARALRHMPESAHHRPAPAVADRFGKLLQAQLAD